MAKKWSSKMFQQTSPKVDTTRLNSFLATKSPAGQSIPKRLRITLFMQTLASQLQANLSNWNFASNQYGKSTFSDSFPYPQLKIQTSCSIQFDQGISSKRFQTATHKASSLAPQTLLTTSRPTNPRHENPVKKMTYSQPSEVFLKNTVNSEDARENSRNLIHSR